MKVMTPDAPFSCSSNYYYNEIYIYHGYILYKVEIIFHNVSFIISTFIFHLCVSVCMTFA